MEDESEFEDRNSNYKKRNLRLISISIIEQFAKIVDDTIDTSKLENIDFIERIPIGMYLFSYIQIKSDLYYVALCVWWRTILNNFI